MQEIWAQDSDIKGLRIIRFERLPDGKLRWRGPIGEPDQYPFDQFVYREAELRDSKWEFIETMTADQEKS